MTIDKEKLRTLAQAVADLEDTPGREDEHAEAVDALWLNMHCHTILALLAEIEQISADRKACWEEFKVQGRQLGQLKAENEALRDVMAAVISEIPHAKHIQPGNSPGHSHRVPGVWDEDNGAKAGRECGWCKVWNTALTMAKESIHD